MNILLINLKKNEILNLQNELTREIKKIFIFYFNLNHFSK
jgi:hypothetical protein